MPDPGAKRSLLTPHVIEQIERYAGQAFTIQRIADAAGVSVATLRGWISVGESDPTSLEAKAVDALRRGYVHSAAELTGCLRDAAMGKDDGDGVKGEWRAAAFLLERVHYYLKPAELPEDKTAEGEDSWAQLALKLAETSDAPQ